MNNADKELRYADIFKRKIEDIAYLLDFALCIGEYGPIDPVQSNTAFKTCKHRIAFDLGGPGPGVGHECGLSGKACSYGYIPGDCARR